MFLKSIEVENFKSFGGKVTIPLMNGYMAVTGPNGSGKSNIGDAIMFVLGPRSPKAVRAARIPDLVFKGTKGKADYMKATLVFDNADRILPIDSDEVRLSRHIKLKGEDKNDYTSYFYVNGNAAKLSDFEDILSKARISADGYNIVQQGDVTGIINMSARDRRGILDGMSGISSFDADLSKAANDRTEAESDLDRIGVVRGERAASLASLEKQKAEALKYTEISDKLTLARNQQAVRQRDGEAENLESRRKHLADIEAEIAKLQASRETLEKEKEENAAAVAAKEEEISRRTGPEYQKIKDEVELAKVDLGTASNIRENNLAEAERKDVYAQQLQESIDENGRNRSELDFTLNDLRAQYNEIKTQKTEADETTQKLTEEIAAHGGELTALQTRLQNIEADIDAKSAEDQAAQGDAASAKAYSEAVELNRSSAEEAVENCKLDFESAKKEKHEVDTATAGNDVELIGKEILELSSREKTLAKQESSLREAYQKKTFEYNRLQAEKNATDAVQGGGKAYDAILSCKNTGEIRGIIGPVCELASVKPGFETAISVAAGAKARAIVVEDDSVGATCIAYLKKNNLPRLTFLPLNKMQPGRATAKTVMVQKQTLGLATEFLNYDSRFTNVFWYVFADTLVVQDIEHGRPLMGGVRMVTKDGDLLDKSGAMTGGTLSQKALVKFGGGQIANAELAAAAAEVQKAKDLLDDAADALRDIRDKMRAADDRMRAANKGSADIQRRIASADVKFTAAKENLEKAQADLKKYTDASVAARNAFASADAKAAMVRTALQALRDQQTSIRDRMAEIAPPDLQERVDTARADSHRFSEELSELTGQIRGIEVEIEGIDDQNKHYSEQIEKAHQEAKTFRDIAASKEADIERLKIDLDAKKSIKERIESGQEELRSQRDALRERGFAIGSDIEKCISSVETKKDLVLSSKAAIANSEENLRVFQAQVDAIVGEIPVNPPSLETLRRTIAEAEAQLHAIPNVNLAAPKMYEEVMKDLQRIDEEVEVLNARIKSLIDLQDDLSARKKGIFMKAFSEIETNFKKLFTELSGGGEASMTLENPEDPFAGGLFINAKPRNGTMLRLEALSGGEKSLTALSFIFAIQECQPSPFYVLDEVDMFLDSVNTELVAKRIKAQSRHTQFIQVSLRKVALTQADNLIGVTRPPSGVSKVVMQVDMSSLDKLEAEAQKRIVESKKEETD